MDNIVLFNNGKVKKLKNKKYKKSKVDGIIISCDSNLFGRLYRFLPVHTYKKMHKCKSCSFRYDFIDGSVIDDDDVDDIIDEYDKHFDKIDEHDNVLIINDWYDNVWWLMIDMTNILIINDDLMNVFDNYWWFLMMP